MQKKNLRRRCVSSFMGVISFVFLSVNFSIPVFSPFAEIDAAALPELIGGFALGPVGAIEIIVIKLVLKLLLVGTETMYTGEMQNLILSLSFSLPAVLYYRFHRNNHGAVIGLIIGGICKVIIAIFTNLYLIFPFYMSMYGMDWDSIIAIFASVNPWIHSIPTMIAFSIVPFNLISVLLGSLVTMLIYKRISTPIINFIQ